MAVAPPLSIVIPARDEGRTLPGALARLASLRAAGVEVVVVDGASRDDTASVAAMGADRVLSSPPGRAHQMNAGAAVASAERLLFLHADTVLPDRALDRMISLLDPSREAWGRFDVRIDGDHRLLRLVEGAMNLRSRVTGIATGDQGIFATRRAFEAVGGFPELALMEDVAISAALRRRARPICLRDRVVTSARRWERDGVVRTIVLMWRLRLAFALGADPARLARRYDG